MHSYSEFQISIWQCSEAGKSQSKEFKKNQQAGRETQSRNQILFLFIRNTITKNTRKVQDN